MFGWSRVACPVSDEVRAWIERRTAWLLREFGWEQSRRRPVVLPTAEFFPEPYDGSPAAARALLDRVASYADVDSSRLELALFDEGSGIAPGTRLVQDDPYAAGVYDAGGVKTTIWIETSVLEDPLVLVATLAHELAHARLLGEGRLSAEAQDHEPLTDLLTVFLGLGVFTANSAVRSLSYHAGNWEGWRISRHGYLSAPIYGYALAIFALLRNETRPAWRSHLSADVRHAMQKGLRWLMRSDGRRSASLGDLLRTVSDPDRDLLPSGLVPWWQRAPQGTPASGSEEEDAGTPVSDPFTLAWAHASRGEWQSAIEQYTRAIQRHPRDAECYQERALALLELGHTQEALSDAECAVRLAPEETPGYHARGVARLANSDFRGAADDFDRVIQDESQERSAGGRLADAYYRRGLAFAAMGELRRAIDDFADARHRAPMWPEIYAARALVYDRLGMTEQAEQDRTMAARLGIPYGNARPDSPA